MKPHDSQRGWFAWSLHQEMRKNKDIWMLTGDLGFGMLNTIRSDFPDRFVNVGAAEQSLITIAVGLALEGKIPFVYSITPFLLWRPAEAIRLYVDHESIPVKLIGGGRDEDYAHDGFSHNARDDYKLMKIWKNITPHWPTGKEEIPGLVRKVIDSGKPEYINLTR